MLKHWRSLEIFNKNYRHFYLRFKDTKIWYARVPNLSWTYFRSLLRVDEDDARYWYLFEAVREMWSTRTLDRNSICNNLIKK